MHTNMHIHEYRHGNTQIHLHIGTPTHIWKLWQWRARVHARMIVALVTGIWIWLMLRLCPWLWQRLRPWPRLGSRHGADPVRTARILCLWRNTSTNTLSTVEFRSLEIRVIHRCPPKGDPKSGIRKKVTLKCLKSDLTIMFKWFLGRIPPLRILLWGMVNTTASDPPCAAHSDYTGVCEKTFLLREPLPDSPAAETALQPLMWCARNY